jgi:hypothetical protein
MKILLAVIVVLALAVSVSAQSSDAAKLNAISRSSSLGIKPASSPFSLLDLSKMHWSQSYSMSFISGGGYSGSVGLLRTSMLYDLSSQFTLGLNLGILHNAGALWGDGSTNASFLPGFWLDYHPSRQFNMSINVQWYQGGYYPFMDRSHYWPGYLSEY